MEQDYTWEYNPPEAKTDGRWEQEVFNTLYTVCIKASNDLWRMENREFLTNKSGCGISTMDDKAIIIADKDTVAALESISCFASVENIDMSQDIHTVGTLGRFVIRRNIKQIENKIEVKWRGKTAIVHVKGLEKSSIQYMR